MSTKYFHNISANMKTTDNPHLVFIQEYSLISEFNLLKNHVERGIYVIPASKTPFIWFGVIFIHHGMYKGGIFRFSLFIPHAFPNVTVSPSLIFESPVFHPQVDPLTQELYLGNNASLINWQKDVNHLWQVIYYLKTIFHNVITDGSVNKQAAHLYETNQDEYLKQVQECVENSKKNIYNKTNDDPHYLMFDSYNAQIHDPFKELLRTGKSNLVNILSI